MMWAGLGDKENFILDVSETENVPHGQYQSPMTQHQLAQQTYHQFPDTQTAGATECNYFGFSEDMKYLPSESGVPASDLSELGLKSDSEAWLSPGALPTQQQVFSFTSFNLPENELSFTFL